MIKYLPAAALITSIITACIPIRSPYISPELKPAYEEWVESCKSKKIPWRREVSRMDSILFAPLEDGYWGKCYGDRIVINSVDIDTTDEFLIKLINNREKILCYIPKADKKGGCQQVKVMFHALLPPKLVRFKISDQLLRIR